MANGGLGRHHSASTSKLSTFWADECSKIIRHELMEMDRTSIVVLAILVSPFSIIFLIKDCLAPLAMSLTGGLGEESRRANFSLSRFSSFSALVSAFLRAAAAVFSGGMLDWDWGREITGGWPYLTSSEDFIDLFGCLTRGSWPLHLPPQTQARPFSHSRWPRLVLTGGSSQMQAGQKIQYSLYFKHLMSHVRCLWGSLLGDRGVLGDW